MRSRPTAEFPATFMTSSEGVRIGPFQVRRGPQDQDALCVGAAGLEPTTSAV